MNQFRTKSVMVKAVQWFKIGDHERVVLRDHPYYPKVKSPMLWTAHGWEIVKPGDWIILDGSKQSVCDPDIFESTYEPVES